MAFPDPTLRGCRRAFFRQTSYLPVTNCVRSGREVGARSSSCAVARSTAAPRIHKLLRLPGVWRANGESVRRFGLERTLCLPGVLQHLRGSGCAACSVVVFATGAQPRTCLTKAGRKFDYDSSNYKRSVRVVERHLGSGFHFSTRLLFNAQTRYSPRELA